MNKQQLVTRRQAIKLKQLGFHDKTCAFAYENVPDLGVSFSFPRNYNKKFLVDVLSNKKERPYISVPTVYEAFDWLIAKLKTINLYWKSTSIRYYRHSGVYWLDCVSVDYDADLCKDKYASYRKAIDILIEAYEKD